VRDAAVDLAKQGMRAEAATLLHRYAVTAPPLDAAESFCELTRKWTSAATLLAPVLVGRQDSARVLAALRTLAPDQFPESLLGLLTYQHVVALCGGLSAQNATMELDTVLTWCAGREDAAELRSVLHEAGLHALGYRLAERVDEMSRSFDHPA
jgi:hypothetical protein